MFGGQPIGNYAYGSRQNSSVRPYKSTRRSAGIYQVLANAKYEVRFVAMYASRCVAISRGDYHMMNPYVDGIWRSTPARRV